MMKSIFFCEKCPGMMTINNFIFAFNNLFELYKNYRFFAVSHWYPGCICEHLLLQVVGYYLSQKCNKNGI